MRLALLRRRNVWLPTLWGWAVLALTAVAVVSFGTSKLYWFLAPRKPVGATLLVVEGWMDPEELDQVRRLYLERGYQRILTIGGPIENAFERRPGIQSYGDRARDYLVRRGLPAAEVVAVSAPDSEQDRSYLNAVMAREWVATSGSGIDALDVASVGPHARRSWLLHALAFGPSARVGVIAVTPDKYNPNTWWRTSAGAKDVITEAVAWLWTSLWFRPPPRGSPEETSGPPD